MTDFDNAPAHLQPGYSPEIRAALDAIAAKYEPAAEAWLATNNPAALAQLRNHEAEVDKAALGCDTSRLRRACLVWRNAWIFWLNSWRAMRGNK